MKTTVPIMEFKRTTRQKIASEVGSATVRVAELKGDPLFKKLRKAQAMVKKLKDAIKAKYGSAGKRMAMSPGLD